MKLINKSQVPAFEGKLLRFRLIRRGQMKNVIEVTGEIRKEGDEIDIIHNDDVLFQEIGSSDVTDNHYELYRECIRRHALRYTTLFNPYYYDIFIMDNPSLVKSNKTLRSCMSKIRSI